MLRDIWATITPRASDEEAADERETASMKIFKKAAEEARAQNLSLVASTLENAIFDNQNSAAYAVDFPRNEDMSGVGLHTFLVGSTYTKGVLWFFPTLDQVRTAIPLIMRHRPPDEYQGPGGGGMASASMFKSDAEMKAIQSFLAWSTEHADHIQEPEFSNVVANLKSASMNQPMA